VKVVDDPAHNLYPMPVDTSNQDLVWVGRIREDISRSGSGLTFWCCGDQIRKGAAVNAVQIAEKMQEMKLLG
jgi:aspartate-semialdehyde dehydrogenase